MQRTFTLALVLGAFASGCSSATTTPVTASPPISVERERVQAGIVAANGVQAAAVLAAVAASLEPPVFEFVRHCRNGVEKTVVPTPDGVLETLDLYYEPSCTHRFVHATLNTLQFVPGRLVIATTFETSTIGGRPVTYGTSISTTFFSHNGSHTTLTGSASTTPKGAALESFGLACTLGTSDECGFGAVVKSVRTNASYGFTAAASGFAGQSGGKGTIAVRAYRGPLGALTLALGRGDTWIVKGGSSIARQTGAFRQSAISKALDGSTSVSLLDDEGTRVDLNDDARSGFTGSLTVSPSSAAPAATFSTDAAGNGRIEYADGSADRIDAFVVL